MIEFEKANKILQQLPVAYYLKRKLEVQLDENANGSYFELLNDKLHISFKQLNQLNETATEQDIRCLLYHEVSHAFLTSVEQANLWLSDNDTDILNIFEDERIETICKNYYLDVNFKEFCIKFNHYDKTTFVPQTVRQYFYQIVRFNDGKQELVDEVKQIIKEYAFICRTSNYADTNQYVNRVLEFYKKVCDDFNKQTQENQQNQNQDTQLGKGQTSNEQTEQTQENQQSGQSGTSQTTKTNEDKEMENALTQSLDNALNELQKAFTNLIDTKFQEEFRQIILEKMKSSKVNGSAINSYSGQFDVRSVGRQDYKYFVQKNRAGNVKRFSKVKLNLFIDNSGSFEDSEDVVNKMLYNLRILENETTDFSFDVITMNTREVLLDKKHRYIKCHGCNLVTPNLITLYNKVQDNTATNINIAMYDGSAFSGTSYRNRDKEIARYEGNFKAFNHSNCIIISDTANERYINKYCGSAKKIIVKDNYANLLISNVVKNLRYGLR